MVSRRHPSSTDDDNQSLSLCTLCSHFKRVLVSPLGTPGAAARVESPHPGPWMFGHREGCLLLTCLPSRLTHGPPPSSPSCLVEVSLFCIFNKHSLNSKCKCNIEFFFMVVFVVTQINLNLSTPLRYSTGTNA